MQLAKPTGSAYLVAAFGAAATVMGASIVTLPEHKATSAAFCLFALYLMHGEFAEWKRRRQR
ncbi:MAG: hypothetical protein ABI634_11245 [Acidobacteriota bacterium]